MNSIAASNPPISTYSARRWAGIAFGFGTQVLFLWTVVYLFLFLRYGATRSYEFGLLVDILLSIGFALPHSLLLMPSIQKRIKVWLPAGLLGCVHCSVTCISLLVMFHFWSFHPMMIWKASGYGELAILIGFYASWVALFYSLYITGMAYQTGLAQWWYWMKRQKPPARVFVETGAYRWMRHPIYMSFLGLIWFTPNMSLDHVVLTGVWTIYIYVGSYAKDMRMLRFVGETYREYAFRVPGLPIIGFGPLLRWK
jgi:protein-S-isoprenylcysteine O-methyltransferase Ste14